MWRAIKIFFVQTLVISYLHMHIGIQGCGWWVAGVWVVVPGVVVVVVGHYLVAEGEVMRRRRRWLGAHQNAARSRIHLPRSGRWEKIACPSDWESAVSETSRPLRASTASEPFRCAAQRSGAHSPPTAAAAESAAPPALHATALAAAAGCCIYIIEKTPRREEPTALENQIIRAGHNTGASQQWNGFAACQRLLLYTRGGSFANL